MPKLQSRSTWTTKTPNYSSLLVLTIIFGSLLTSLGASSPESNGFSESTLEYRRQYIRNMTLSAWTAYRTYAWGGGQLAPLFNTTDETYDSFQNDSGKSIVASLSTLWLMDLQEEYSEARKWISEQLDLSLIERDLPVHEVVNQYLGGLLSAYALTKDSLFLEKAQQIAQQLVPAYNESSGVPAFLFNFKEKSVGAPLVLPLSAIGGQHLEYVYLSDLTGDRKYRLGAQKRRAYLTRLIDAKGRYPEETLTQKQLPKWSLNGASREFFRSLLRASIQSNGQDLDSLKQYVKAIEDLRKSQIIVQEDGIIYARPCAHARYSGITNCSNPKTEYCDSEMRCRKSMDYSACYLGSMLTRGALTIEKMAGKIEAAYPNEKWLQSAPKEHRHLAEKLVESCSRIRSHTKTQLNPESWYPAVEGDGKVIKKSSSNLSPELAESYFILWRLTHQEAYREAAWSIARAIERHLKTASGGYAELWNVNDPTEGHTETQPAHFFSGTLPFLYLTFADDTLLPLSEWLFNAVGHPLPICGVNDAYPKCS